jgi:hypothetical protein
MAFKVYFLAQNVHFQKLENRDSSDPGHGRQAWNAKPEAKSF